MKRQRFLYFFNDRGHFRRFLWGMTFVSFLAGIGLVFIPEAWATSFSCSNGTATGNLFDLDTIGNVVNDQSGGSYTINTSTTSTNGDPFGTTCPQSLGIFGTILCFFKSTIGQITSTMYCTIQQNLLSPVSIALELFIVLFGVAVMTGIVRFTPREAIIALFKIALVWTFAMNATWGIGVGYSFFIGLAEQGSNMVVNAVGNASGGAASGAGGYLTQQDNVLQGMFSLISTGSGGGSTLAFPSTLTQTCAVWMVAFIAILVLFVPMVGGFLVTMMIQYIMLYVRAFLGYLTALVLISFLFILSPIFISFALFQITRPIFEQWLKHLISFALQMIMVFAFLVLLGLIPIGAFFSELLGLLREYDTTTTTFIYPLPMTFCSVCDYAIGSGNISDATPPITCADNNAIPIGKLFLDTDLVQAVLSQIVALWIIGTVMQDFLRQAPQFASEIAGGLPLLSMGGNDGAQGVTFAGLDDGGTGGSALDSDDSMEALRNRLEDYRSKISLRAAPGIVTAALAAGNMFSKRAGSTNTVDLNGSGSGSSTRGATGTGTTAAGKTSFARAGSSSVAGGKSASASSGSGAAASSGMSVARMGLISSNQSLMMSGDPAQVKIANQTQFIKDHFSDSTGSLQAALQRVNAFNEEKAKYEDALSQIDKYQRDKAKVDPSQYNQALQQVEMYKAEQGSGLVADPLKYQEALKILNASNESWKTALTNLTASNQALLNAKIAKAEVSPVSLGAQGSSVPQNLSAYLPPDQIRDQVNLSLKNLQLRINVQEALLPTKDARTADKDSKAGQAAQKELDAALSESLTASSGEALDQVLAHLDTVEKLLDGRMAPPRDDPADDDEA